MANDGDYTIKMQPNQVGDSAGDFVVSQPMARFSIAIAPAAIANTSAADTFYVQVDPLSVYTEVFVNTPVTGDPTYLFSPTVLSPLTINGLGGNDSATVDFSVGNPLPTGGFSFDGGTGVNALSVIGSNDFDSTTIDASQLIFGNVPLAYANTQSIIVDGGYGTSTLEQLAQPNATVAFGGTGADTLIIDAGTFTYASIPALDTSTTTVFDFSSVVFGAPASSQGITPQTFAALNIGPGAVATMSNAASHLDRSVLVLGSLVESSSSKLNVGSNDMIVRGGNLATINRALKNGFNAAAHGYWNGNGINSSVAAANTRYLTAVGVRLSNGAAFDGVDTGTADVLVKYTYYGDADLTGILNGADYQQIDRGFGAHLTGWVNGDFNYDGVINGTDFTLLDNALNQVFATGAAPLALIAGGSPTVAASAVPPPKQSTTSAAPIAIAAAPVASGLFSNTASANSPLPLADLLDLPRNKKVRPATDV